MECDSVRMCGLLGGLADVEALGVDGQPDSPMVVYVESCPGRAWCRVCGVRATVKDRPAVELVDRPCFGRPGRLVWRKRRWCCVERACPRRSWAHVDERIAAPRMAMMTRAARWATRQVGELGRSGERGRRRSWLRLAHGQRQGDRLRRGALRGRH